MKIKRADGKHAAVYVRVSSKSQEPDLKRSARSQTGPIRWYRDTLTGKTMDRPGDVRGCPPQERLHGSLP